jgi:hypothetical protein
VSDPNPAVLHPQARSPFPSFVLDPALIFARVLDSQSIARVVAEEVGKTGDRIFTPLVTVAVFLSQLLSDDPTCLPAVAGLLAWRVACGRPACSPDTGGYCKARQRLPETLLPRLARETADGLQENAPEAWLFHGRRVVIADGTAVSMPDTPENQAEYPQHTLQKPGCGFPIARIVVLISLATGGVLDAAIGAGQGKLTGEMALIRRLHGRLKRGDIVLADSYYSSFDEVVTLAAMGVDVVMRQHGGRRSDFRRGTRLGREDHLVEWQRSRNRPGWMSREEFAALPRVLVMREIKVRVDKRGFRTRVFVVVTTLVWLDLSSPKIWDWVSLPVGDDTTVGAGNDPTGGEVFSLQGSFLSRLFLLRRGGGPGHDAIVTTVDQSGIRVLANALNDPTGASSLYKRASAPKSRPKGGPRVPPIRTHNRGLARRSAASGSLNSSQDSLTHRASRRQEHLLAGDRPDESYQLTSHRRHRPGRRFPLLLEADQTLVEPLLGLPRDHPHRSRHAVVALPDRLAHPRLTLVVPGRFDQDSPHVGVARASDPALAATAAAGVLRRHQAHERHQLRRRGEPPEVADLGHQRHRANHLNTSQGLQGGHEWGLLPGGGSLGHFLGEPGHSRGRHLDRLAIIVHDVLLGRLVEGLLSQPGLMSWSPGRLAREPAVVTEEKLRQLLTCRSLGAFGVVASPLEVADGLGDHVDDVDRREVPRAEVMSQVASVAAVGLDAGTRLDRDQRRSDDVAGDLSFDQPPGQSEAGGSGFVATAQGFDRPESLQPLDQANDIVGDGGERFRRQSVAFGDGDGDRVAMDIETNELKCGTVVHGPVLPVSALH